MFHFSAYWRNWSRVLWTGPANGPFQFVEVDLMPIPGCASSTWDDIKKINIRRHSTARSSGDVSVKSLPADVHAMMIAYLNSDLTVRLLTEDFYSQIDWELYEKYSRGGAPFDLIRIRKRISSTMKKNTKLIVSDEAPFHKGRVGFFQFRGEGPSRNCIVLSTKADGHEMFVVDIEHLLVPMTLIG